MEEILRMTIDSNLVFQIVGWIVVSWVFVTRLDKRISITEIKIDDLRHKQEKYNNLQERMICCEQKLKDK